jgi:hypothetical protein
LHPFARAALALAPLAAAAGCAAVAPAPAPSAQTPSGEPVAVPPGAEARASAVAGQEQPAPAPAASAPRDALDGYVSARYRARWTDDDRDHDLYLLAALDYADPERPALSAHVMARSAADLDGQDGGGGFVFDSLSDTYSNSVEAKLYHAYVDYEPADAPASLRAGRQIDYATPEVAFFDGVAVRSRPRGAKAFQAGVYGGLPVHLYESSPEGDSLFGSFVEARPWKGGRARLDWMHIEDDRRLGSFADDLVGVALWQALAREWSLDLAHTRIESEARDVRARARYSRGDGALAARLSYYELLETQQARALEVDPFTSALQEYFPYRQVGAGVSRQVTKRTRFDLGADVRRVSDDDDVGEYNRDWERYYATASVQDAFVPGLTLSVTADQWDGEGRDIGTWGADATREIGERWRVSAGSYYSLYKYDLYANEERDDVRSYYARARFEKSDRLRFDLGYEFEDDDFEEYHLVRWGMTWRF